MIKTINKLQNNKKGNHLEKALLVIIIAAITLIIGLSLLPVLIGLVNDVITSPESTDVQDSLLPLFIIFVTILLLILLVVEIKILISDIDKRQK